MRTLPKIALGVIGALVAASCGAAVSAQSGQPVRTPRLPSTPHRYVAIGLPAHFEATHAQDNTPRANRLTDAGAALGRVLFYDTQLSANNTTACASCHLQKHAFADPAAPDRRGGPRDQRVVTAAGAARCRAGGGGCASPPRQRAGHGASRAAPPS